MEVFRRLHVSFTVRSARSKKALWPCFPALDTAGRLGPCFSGLRHVSSAREHAEPKNRVCAIPANAPAAGPACLLTRRGTIWDRTRETKCTRRSKRPIPLPTFLPARSVRISRRRSTVFAYGRERIVLDRRGRSLAALIPLEDLALLEELEDRQDAEEARKAPRPRASVRFPGRKRKRSWASNRGNLQGRRFCRPRSRAWQTSFRALTRRGSKRGPLIQEVSLSAIKPSKAKPRRRIDDAALAHSCRRLRRGGGCSFLNMYCESDNRKQQCPGNRGERLRNPLLRSHGSSLMANVLNFDETQSSRKRRTIRRTVRVGSDCELARSWLVGN